MVKFVIFQDKIQIYLISMLELSLRIVISWVFEFYHNSLQSLYYFQFKSTRIDRSSPFTAIQNYFELNYFQIDVKSICDCQKYL